MVLPYIFILTLLLLLFLMVSLASQELVTYRNPLSVNWSSFMMEVLYLKLVLVSRQIYSGAVCYLLCGHEITLLYLYDLQTALFKILGGDLTQVSTQFFFSLCFLIPVLIYDVRLKIISYVSIR